MIYSVNFLEMTEKINPLALSRYLAQTGWTLFPFKRTDVQIYQYTREKSFWQAMVPLDRTLHDYKQTMLQTVNTVAEVENKPIEQVMLFLLNPNTDIIKIRLENKELEAGNILFDDAIQLYDNAKKLLAATALDIINPKKIHYGRIDDSVQSFLNQCRFGQTEIGSYIVSIVCPFGEISEDDGYKQLSIFSEEDACAYSLTRKVTNKLMDNLVYIKRQIDMGKLDTLAKDDNGISSNFYEALNGLNFKSDHTLVDFRTEWSPNVTNNRSTNNYVRVTSDYYQPISAVIEQIKGKTNQHTEIFGKIRQLNAAPNVDNRDLGTIVVVFVDNNSRIKSATVDLKRDDYEKAVEAHQHGNTVKIIGDLVGKARLRIENPIFCVME